MSTLSRTFALRAGREVDSNQEIIALGAVNMATGFFQGFPVTSSASRTPVAESAGAKRNDRPGRCGLHRTFTDLRTECAAKPASCGFRCNCYLRLHQSC